MNIWFNRWFSTASHFIEKIRNNPDGKEFTIFGTHPNLYSTYLQACDVVEQEPDVKGEEYINWCLDFCKKHDIHVFIPRKENVTVSKNLARFEEIGVKVLVNPDSDLMVKMDNKAEMYRELEGKDIVTIPDYHIVTTAEQFKEAYNDLKEKGHRVCFKPVIGEGAAGFRVLDDTADDITQLFAGINHKISFNRAYELLSQKETFEELMVLEYLDEYEYSIDCIGYNGQLLSAVPRKKEGGRIYKLEDKPELLEIARKFTEEYNLTYVYNIQVKYKDGVPKLLEVNPRMSGGLHLTCLSGVNYPYEALKLLLEGNPEVLKPNYNVTIGQLEKEFIWQE